MSGTRNLLNCIKQFQTGARCCLEIDRQLHHPQFERIQSRVNQSMPQLDRHEPQHHQLGTSVGSNWWVVCHDVTVMTSLRQRSIAGLLGSTLHSMRLIDLCQSVDKLEETERFRSAGTASLFTTAEWVLSRSIGRVRFIRWLSATAKWFFESVSFRPTTANGMSHEHWLLADSDPPHVHDPEPFSLIFV